MPIKYLTPEYIETARQGLKRGGVDPRDADVYIGDFISRNIDDYGFKSDYGYMKSANPDGLSSFLDFKAYGTSDPVERYKAPELEVEKQSPKTLPGKLLKRQLNALEDIGEFGQNGLMRTNLRVAGEAAGGAVDIFGFGLKTVGQVLDLFTPDNVQDELADQIHQFAQKPGVQKLLEYAANVGESYEEFSKKHPDVAEDIAAFANLASIAPLGEGAQLTKQVAKKGLSKVPLVKQKPTTLSNAVRLGMEKGIKPTVKGKKSIKDWDRFYQDAEDAVTTIVKNKEALSYTDDFGEEIVGQLPKSIRQFAEAIDQTKKSVFKQYDDVARAAGQEGAIVNLNPIADELIEATMSSSMAPLRDRNPEVIKFIEQRAAALTRRGSYNMEQAQEAIKLYNSSLNSYYRNPTFDTFSKAEVDALIVNMMRKSMDDAVQNATGAEYQAIKSQYSSLKAIEEQVAHRAMIDARKNNRGLVDFSDIFSAGDVTHGILSGQPALIGKGAGQFFVKSWFNKLNDPNRAIEQMFRHSEILSPKVSPSANFFNLAKPSETSRSKGVQSLEGKTQSLESKKS